jgi:hypothetical protein
MKITMYVVCCLRDVHVCLTEANARRIMLGRILGSTLQIGAAGAYLPPSYSRRQQLAHSPRENPNMTLSLGFHVSWEADEHRTHFYRAEDGGVDFAVFKSLVT